MQSLTRCYSLIEHWECKVRGKEIDQSGRLDDVPSAAAPEVVGSDQVWQLGGGGATLGTRSDSVVEVGFFGQKSDRGSKFRIGYTTTVPTGVIVKLSRSTVWPHMYNCKPQILNKWLPIATVILPSSNRVSKMDSNPFYFYFSRSKKNTNPICMGARPLASWTGLTCTAASCLPIGRALVGGYWA